MLDPSAGGTAPYATGRRSGPFGSTRIGNPPIRYPQSRSSLHESADNLLDNHRACRVRPLAGPNLLGACCALFFHGLAGLVRADAGKKLHDIHPIHALRVLILADGILAQQPFESLAQLHR